MPFVFRLFELCEEVSTSPQFPLGHQSVTLLARESAALQGFGPQKCVAFSVDGSKLATGGLVSLYIVLTLCCIFLYTSFETYIDIV